MLGAPAQLYPSQDRKNILISSKSNVKLNFSFSCKQTANKRQKVFSYVKKLYKSFLLQRKPLDFSFSTSLFKNRR